MKPALSKFAQGQIENIARTVFNVRTLEAEGNKNLNIAVLDIKAALEQAYLAGMVAPNKTE